MSSNRSDIWPGRYDLIVLDETDSTNAEAARRAGGLTRPTWILARRQTAPRGRRGRAWATPAGNFAATLLMPTDLPPARAALHSYTASLALLMALRDVADAPGYALKWPNDLLLNGGKVAGILLESAGRGQRLDWLAVGVGVNLVTGPPAAALDAAALRPVTVLDETGIRIDPLALMDWLAMHFDVLAEAMATHGFEVWRGQWLRAAAGVGRTITARTGSQTLTGIFETIDENGHLVLSLPAGRRAIPAAEVFFQEP